MDDSRIIKHLKTSEFLSHVNTKQDMTVYLSKKLETTLTKTKITYVISYKNKCLTNVMDFNYSLQGPNHEEVDTLIISHCFQIRKIDPFREVAIVCSDTDVLLILLYHYQTLCTQTIMRVGRGDHKQDINIGKSFEALGDAKSQVLVGFHTFTGCDQTGKFNNHAKQLCWNTFTTSPKKIIDTFMLLGNSIKHPTEECIDGIIMFVLNLYCKNRPTDIDNL